MLSVERDATLRVSMEDGGDAVRDEDWDDGGGTKSERDSFFGFDRFMVRNGGSV